MPQNTLTGAAYSASRSFLAAQDSGFRHLTSADGQLVRDRSINRLSGRLVAKVENSQGRVGRGLGRVVKALVGRDSYATISRKLEDNRDASINNMLDNFFRGVMKDEWANSTLAMPMREKKLALAQEISAKMDNHGKLTRNDFEKMATEIRNATDQSLKQMERFEEVPQELMGKVAKRTKILAQQAEQRALGVTVQAEFMDAVAKRTERLTQETAQKLAQEAVEKAKQEIWQQPRTQLVQGILDRKELTPAMQALTPDERRVAILALNNNWPSDKALARAGVDNGAAVELEKIDAVAAEKKVVDEELDKAYKQITEGFLNYYDRVARGGYTSKEEVLGLSAKTREALGIEDEFDAEAMVNLEKKDWAMIRVEMRGNEETAAELPTVNMILDVNKLAYVDLLMAQDDLVSGSAALKDVYGARHNLGKVDSIMFSLPNPDAVRNTEIANRLRGLETQSLALGQERNDIENSLHSRRMEGKDAQDLVARGERLKSDALDLYQQALEVQRSLAPPPRQDPSHTYRAVDKQAGVVAGPSAAEVRKLQSGPEALLEVETDLQRIEGELNALLQMGASEEQLVAARELAERLEEQETRLQEQESRLHELAALPGQDSSKASEQRQRLSDSLKDALETGAQFKEQLAETLTETENYLDPANRRARDTVIRAMLEQARVARGRASSINDELSHIELTPSMQAIVREFEDFIDESLTPFDERLTPVKETEV